MNVLHILRRELLAFFFSPIAWIILTLFLLVQGYSFYLLAELLNQPQPPHGAVMQFFFGGTFIYWLFVIFIVAVLAMRLLAEERHAGTLETLLTAPVSETEVVLGKYIAVVIAYAFLWLPTLVYVVVVRHLAGPQTLGWGPIATGYLGTMAVGSALLAVGMLASALAKHQIIAAMLTLAWLTLLLLLGPLDLFISEPLGKELIGYINLFDHMEDFSRGIVDSRHLVFYFSLILFCLALSVKTLEVKKWR